MNISHLVVPAIILLAILAVVIWAIFAVRRAVREPSPSHDIAAWNGVFVLSCVGAIVAAALYVNHYAEEWVYFVVAALAAGGAIFFVWRSPSGWTWLFKIAAYSVITALPPLMLGIASPGWRSFMDKGRRWRALEAAVPGLAAVRDKKASPESVVPALATVVRDGPELARNPAIKQLGSYKEASAPAVPALEAVVQEGGDLSYSALDALAEIGPVAEPALLRSLTHANEAIRLRSGQYFRDAVVVSSASLPAVLELAKEERPEARAAAMAALGRTASTPPGVTEALIAGLKDADAGVRRDAAGGLGLVGGNAPEIVASLADALKDPDEYVRGYALEALGKRGQDARPMAPLTYELVFDRSDYVQTQAFRFLRGVKPRPVDLVDVLRRALNGRTRTQAEALSLLGEIGAEASKAVDDIERVLTAGNPDNRLYALYALMAIGPASKTARATVEKYRNDPDKVVRWRCLQALAAMDGKNPQLIRLGNE